MSGLSPPDDDPPFSSDDASPPPPPAQAPMQETLVRATIQETEADDDPHFSSDDASAPPPPAQSPPTAQSSMQEALVRASIPEAEANDDPPFFSAHSPSPPEESVIQARASIPEAEANDNLRFFSGDASAPAQSPPEEAVVQAHQRASIQEAESAKRKAEVLPLQSQTVVCNSRVSVAEAADLGSGNANFVSQVQGAGQEQARNVRRRLDFGEERLQPPHNNVRRGLNFGSDRVQGRPPDRTTEAGVDIDELLGLVYNGRTNILIAASACNDIIGNGLARLVDDFEEESNVIVVLTRTAKRLVDASGIRCKIYSNTESWFYRDTHGFLLSDVLSEWATNVIVVATSNCLAKVSMYNDNNLLTMLTGVAPAKVYIIPNFGAAQWGSAAVRRIVVALRANGFKVLEMTDRFPTMAQINEFISEA